MWEIIFILWACGMAWYAVESIATIKKTVKEINKKLDSNNS